MICVKGNLPKSEVTVATTKKKRFRCCRKTGEKKKGLTMHS